MTTEHFTETVAKWDAIAQAGTDHARPAIHPAGAEADGAYEHSGELLADRLIPYVAPFHDVADFGAGDGRVTIPLAKALGVDRVTGIDASPAMIDALRRRADAEGLTGLEVELNDGTRPLSRRYDVIIALAVLIHHDHRSVARIVANLAKSLNPAGRLILDLPITEGEPNDPDRWIDVGHWTRRELAILTAALDLELEVAGLIDGFIVLEVPGVEHSEVVSGTSVPKR